MSLGIIFMGFFVGFLVGLTGVGGAALLTPILILLGINPTIAVGTDLAYNSVTKFFGSIGHWRQKTINLQLVKHLSIGSLPGAVIAVFLLRMFENFFHYQEQLIKMVLGYVLIFVALTTLYKTFYKPKNKLNPIQAKTINEKKYLTISIGLLFGFLVGLTSVGSGSLFAVAMLLFYNLKPSELVGTDIAHAFFLVTIAGILHAGLGNVDYVLTGNLLVGSIPGVLIGSSLSAKFSPKPLRAVLAVLIFLSGLKLI
ncbi:sulfite exporter TauE/SafE family protein [Bacillus andreraoultii]|uniref:sulfite exporter TauE/SafE family protein n=1 Tax=Bacillus andreraoultii TaxID=1499685 RepID=UPI0005396926|nr:sulfite exporter TauE/SafE family protein [Bacillus andreraoultii]